MLVGFPLVDLELNDYRACFFALLVCFRCACGALYCSLYPDKMFTHRKYFCGESAQRTEAQAKTQRKGGAPCE